MLYEDKDYSDPDSKEELTLALSRTIEEVFDKKEGVFIKSSEFFKQSEGELVSWRRTLEESILIGQPRLVCSHCDQMVKLLGRRTERGKIAFFAHLHDSDDCDIKTTGSPMSKEEFLAKKYGKIRESERHMRLKGFIAEMLSTPRSVDAGVSNVEIEKTVKSNLPYLNWRKPDVMADYKGKKIVFELQLSTTFLGVVVDRDIFYRLNNYFIIWVFNFDDNQEYVNLENLMCKDIYYANKRNVFLLDHDAQIKSKEEGKLYLKCRWIDENNKFTTGSLVAVDELLFDEEQCKPYYVDADEIYYKTHPYSRLQIKRIEHTRLEIVEGLMARMNRKYEEQLRWEQLQQEAISIMKENGENATPYFKDGLYGYKYKDTVLVYPFYKEAGEIKEDGYGRVSKSRKQGLVDKFGMSVIPCLYKNVLPVGDGHFIVNLANYWKLFGQDEPIRKVSSCDAWHFNKINDKLSIASLKHETRALRGPNTSKEVDILIYNDGHCRFFKNIQASSDSLMMKAHISSPYGYYGFKDCGECEIDTNGEIFLAEKEGLHIVISNTGKYGLANSNYKIVIECQYKLLVRAKEKIFIATDNNGNQGVIDSDNNPILPFEYCSIINDEVDNTYWLVQKETGWGIISDNRKTIIPCDYDSINRTTSNTWKVKKGSKYGIAKKNAIIIPISFDSIDKISNLSYYNRNVLEYNDTKIGTTSKFKELWLVSRDNSYGLFDHKFRMILSCKYKHIKLIDKNYAQITPIEKETGIIQLYSETTIISPIYDSIELRNDNNFICKTNGNIFLFTYNGEYLFHHCGTEISELISNKYVLVKEGLEWNLYNLASGELVFRDCAEQEKITVNNDDTIDLARRVENKNYKLRINKQGKEIPKAQIIDSTSYTVSRFKQSIKISNSAGETIVPYGDYTYKLIDKEIKIECDQIEFRINDITHGDIISLQPALRMTSVCGRWGVFTEDWKKPIVPYAYTKIELKNKLLFVTKDDKVGVYSLDGKIILYPIYLVVRPLSNGYFVCDFEKTHLVQRVHHGMYRSWITSEVVRRTTSTILKDSHGFPLLSEYDGIEIPGDYEEDKLCVKYKNQNSFLNLKGELILENIIYIDDERYVYRLFGKYGLRNKNKSILDPTYESITPCEDGNIIVNNGRKCVLLNSSLNEIITDSSITCICFGKYLTSNSYSNKVYDSNGKVIKRQFRGHIKKYPNGLILLSENNNGSWTHTFVDEDLNPTYKLEDSVSVHGDFKDGKIEIRKNNEPAFLTENFEILPYQEKLFYGQCYKFQIFGKWGLKIKGEIVLEAKYKDITFVPFVGYILSGPYFSSMCSLEGKIIIDGGYNKIEPIKSFKNLFFVEDFFNHGLGICDGNGNELIAPSYNSISIYKGHFLVMKKTNWRSKFVVELYGLFSTSGKVIMPCNYTGIYAFNDNIFHGVGIRLNDYVKTDGTILKATKLTLQADGWAISEFNKKYGLVDEFGNEIISPMYQEMSFSDGIYKGRKRRTWYDVVKNKVISFDKEGLSLLKDGLYSCEENGKFGVINSYGETLQPFVYDTISLDDDNKIIGTLGSQSVDINLINLSAQPNNGDICIGKVARVVIHGLHVNVGKLNTGLLHRSKLREKSLYDYSQGDIIIVRILSIHDDGKVDYELY